MAASLRSPAVVERREVLLVVRSHDGPKARCGHEVQLVGLTVDAELRWQIEDVASRAKLANQAPLFTTVVKVYRYHAATLRGAP